ncbi:MAG: hypothetical protein IJL19_01100 [Clostridiales bacterium]|nr:hypothetical protein [Clostridiales bacterium]
MASVETVSFKKIKRKRRTSKADIAFNIFLGVFFALFMIVTLYPIINTLAYSFNDRFDVIENGPVHIFPRARTLENYNYALSNFHFKDGITITAARPDRLPVLPEILHHGHSRGESEGVILRST